MRRGWTGAVAAALAVCAAGLTGATMAAAPAAAVTAAPAADRWRVQPVPRPPGARKGTELPAVSCVSATDCTAVGYLDARGKQVSPLAEHWDGRAWAVQATPAPAGTSDGELLAVSCVSATACVAVGVTDDPLGSVLADVWNGSGWAAQVVPGPPDASSSELTSIACRSADRCDATGVSDVGGRAQTLAMSWNGRGWSVASTPSPAPDNELEGVSCAGRATCTAVGYDYPVGPDSVQVPLALRWNGRAWQVQPTADPPGVQASYLLAVSGPPASDCTAVGYTNAGASSPPLPLAEQWNGATWTIEATPLPARSAGGGELVGISCASAANCTAVGQAERGAGAFVALAERWTGTRWVLEKTAAPQARKSLAAISCVSGRTCTAVGASTGAGAHGWGLLAEQD
jgi:hypothetical protein